MWRLWLALTAGFFSSHLAVQCVGYPADFPAGGRDVHLGASRAEDATPKRRRHDTTRQEDEFHYETFLSEL